MCLSLPRPGARLRCTTCWAGPGCTARSLLLPLTQAWTLSVEAMREAISEAGHIASILCLDMHPWCAGCMWSLVLGAPVTIHRRVRGREPWSGAPPGAERVFVGSCSRVQGVRRGRAVCDPQGPPPASTTQDDSRPTPLPPVQRVCLHEDCFPHQAALRPRAGEREHVVSFAPLLSPPPSPALTLSQQCQDGASNDPLFPVPCSSTTA